MDEDSSDIVEEVYSVVGNEESYLSNRESWNPHFEEIDNFIGQNSQAYGLESDTRVELAEFGFLSYHDKGFLESGDKVAVYIPEANTVERVEMHRESDLVDEHIEAFFGKNHLLPGSEKDCEPAIPVKFTEEGYSNIVPYMPAHDAVKREKRDFMQDALDQYE